MEGANTPELDKVLEVPADDDVGMGDGREGDVERGGQVGEQLGRGPLGLALVVGDHAVGDADLVGEFLLGVSRLLAQLREPFAESLFLSVLALGHRSPLLDAWMRSRVQAVFVEPGDLEGGG